VKVTFFSSIYVIAMAQCWLSL